MMTFFKEMPIQYRLVWFCTCLMCLGFDCCRLVLVARSACRRFSLVLLGVFCFIELRVALFSIPLLAPVRFICGFYWSVMGRFQYVTLWNQLSFIFVVLFYHLIFKDYLFCFLSFLFIWQMLNLLIVNFIQYNCLSSLMC